MGEEDDVKNIYANTSGVLISSDREGSPKVLFEALFCNIPVISTSVGIMPDLLPSACLSESNDESFKELLEVTIPKIDEIHESCTPLFNEAKTKYTLKIKMKGLKKFIEPCCLMHQDKILLFLSA